MQTITELAVLTAGLQEKLNQAMANLTHQPVQLSLQEGGLISIKEVHQLVAGSEQASTAIYIPIMGEVTGDIFLFMPQLAAQATADLMIGNPVGTTTMITDFESSALKEMGNITTGVIVTEIANLLKISMMLTVPNLATDMIGALIDQVLIEYGETADELLILRFPFVITKETASIEGSFVLFFDKVSSDLIMKAIKNIGGTIRG